MAPAAIIILAIVTFTGFAIPVPYARVVQVDQLP